MKNKFIIVLSLVFVFGLFVTAFAFNGSAPSAVQTDCPMKMNAAASTENVDMKNVVVVRSGEDCCEKGADCCKGGSCCKHKK